MSNLVEVKDVYKDYGFHKKIFNGLNLTIESGKIIGLLGPNGSGKTTLIKLLAGLLTQNQGEILIDGNPIGVETKKVVSYLPERTYLNEYMTVEQCVNMFKDFYEDFDVERANKMLELLKIETSQKVKKLSKGTKEKVQLILVMSRRAKLYLLDEPIAGVDPAARDYILDTILTNYDENATILLSTHLISDIENILDEVIFIKEGQIIDHKAADDLRDENGKSIDELFREVFRC